MQALKVLVITMAVLIFVGFAVVVVTIANRMSAAGRAEGFGEVALDLAAPCRIAEARADGGTLVVRIDGPADEGCQQVIIVNTESGAIVGRLSGSPAP